MVDDKNVSGQIIYVDTRGFGFIKADGYGDENVFFHAKDLRGVAFEDIKKHDRVVIAHVQHGDKSLVGRQVSKL